MSFVKTCLNCRRDVYEGHVDCNCEKNHPSDCFETNSRITRDLKRAQVIFTRDREFEQGMKDAREYYRDLGEYE